MADSVRLLTGRRPDPVCSPEVG